jgi:hypothetical protein
MVGTTRAEFAAEVSRAVSVETYNIAYVPADRKRRHDILKVAIH